MASTKLHQAVPWLLAFLIPLTVFPAVAAQPVIAVAPLAHSVTNVRNGLAGLLTTEIAMSGYLRTVGSHEVAALLTARGITPGDYATLSATDLAPLDGVADYILVGEVTAFTVGDRDQKMDMGDQFADLSRLMGAGSEVAQVSMSLRLLEVATGAELDRWQVEGVESRDGLRQKSLSSGWLGSVDFATTDFSETMIGHAALKAIGNALWELYTLLPLRGRVLAVSGDAVVVDLDDSNGLTVGDELTIVRVNDIVVSSGEIAWRDAERVGSVQVVEFQPGHALCLVLDGAGLIAEGDEARPVVLRYTLPKASDVG